MDIDFVITWVDGSDPKWLAEKAMAKGLPVDENSLAISANRYRDWDNLHYWFRGIEKNTPWVHKIYFVTWGHVPAWLNVDHPKIQVVRHEDYMPMDALPTFSSASILSVIHKIPGLSEHFVVINDDMFLLSPTMPEDLFVNGLPCDQLIFDTISANGTGDIFSHMMLNNLDIINRHFNKQEILRRQFRNIFFSGYGFMASKSLLLLPWKTITGFYNHHLIQPYLKSSFEEVERLEPELFRKTTYNKFRTKDDITEWVVRYWQLASGKYYPRRKSLGVYMEITNDIGPVTELIRNGKAKCICINDSDPNIDFEICRDEINKAFQDRFPLKSQFER